MSLTSLIHKGSRLFGFKIERAVSSFGNNLAAYDINKNDYSVTEDKINFKRLNVEIPRKNCLPLLEGYENALKLVDKKGAKFFIDTEESLNIKIDTLQFRINDEEELFILCEVFLEGSYNLITSTQKEIVLIDIGMNVGITSMFYASKPNVRKVFSFEPFYPTYNLALHNIHLNELFAPKIETNNYGLAKEDATMVVNYSLRQKGRMGLNGLPDKSNTIADNFKKESIVLKSVTTAFAKIKEETAGQFVVCKMDCEGAEYEIIDSLYKAQQLSSPDVYFIEWHYKSPEHIVSSLINSNYNVISTTFKSLNSGMIYAIKQ
jgi:FkbM family methyltransferase